MPKKMALQIANWGYFTLFIGVIWGYNPIYHSFLRPPFLYLTKKTKSWTPSSRRSLGCFAEHLVISSKSNSSNRSSAEWRFRWSCGAWSTYTPPTLISLKAGYETHYFRGGGGRIGWPARSCLSEVYIWSIFWGVRLTSDDGVVCWIFFVL